MNRLLGFFRCAVCSSWVLSVMLAAPCAAPGQDPPDGGAPAPEPPAAPPQPVAARELDEVIVLGRSDSLIGIAESASQGTIGAAQLQSRPLLRPGEVAETVPGLIVTQHSGSGKANQFFLRGFNLDHGTDLATFVNGVPVNMPSHAHGQGYTDFNFLIPELVETVNFRKGPYYAQAGDFASAGEVRMEYFDALPQTIARVEGGMFGYQRGLAASSTRIGPGTLIYAAEVLHDDGPWTNPDDFVKFNGLIGWSGGTADHGYAIRGMAYHGEWNSTDQIAKRAVDQGLISRFGAQDPSDGGISQRYSLSADWHKDDGDTRTRAQLYSHYYTLDLFSNFTYFLDDPVNGDQFEQKDRRVVSGLTADHEWLGKFWCGRDVSSTLGFQVRNDWIQNGLFHTIEQKRIGTTRRDHILETSFGPYAEHKTQWSDGFRTVAGVRGDLVNFDVDSDDPQNSGDETAFRPSPKLSLIFGPWAKNEIYVSGGYGLHSNDARGVTSTIDPGTGSRITSADPLVQTRGAEAGVRTHSLAGLQSTLAFWVLESDSELLFVGDAGTTEASRPSRRYGVELANFYDLMSWLALDLDFAYSWARFTDDEPEGDHIPGSVASVIAAGLSVKDLHGFFGSVRLRFFGPRPLVEDDSIRSSSTTLVSAQVGHRFTPSWDLALDIFNLLDAEDNDIEYFYTSRLQGEAAGGVDDRHFHPVEPFGVRLALTGRF